jgi:putative pyruvate formate lyase activating enzyme
MELKPVFRYINHSMKFEPSYMALHRSGELQKRADRLMGMLRECTLCPHNCRNNRLKNELARCHSGHLPIVSSSCMHFGEEPALGGMAGVGNIFFANCTLQCVYCQNHQISQNWKAEQKNEVSIESLAEMMLELQKSGARAIGFVTPAHFIPQIIQALQIATSSGLCVPLIYNTNAFDSVEVLTLLNGIIDIYLPDLKYGNDEFAFKYSGVHSYTEIAHAAIAEMYHQVGAVLDTDENDLINRGLVIRHLVLPNDLAMSEDVLRWIAEKLDARVTVSVMAQYFPAHKAVAMDLLSRKLREREYEKVMAMIQRFGLQNGWTQEFDSSDYYQPDFSNKKSPFPIFRKTE